MIHRRLPNPRVLACAFLLCPAAWALNAQPANPPVLTSPLGTSAPKTQTAPPARPGTATAPAARGGVRTIGWEELVPADWDPMADFKDVRLGNFSDSDPRAAQLLKRMRQTWDSAPTNPALQGVAVRIAGYVVPLEETRAGLTEFLLVPYFGACIHSPPPPANQIIHVRPRNPVPGLSTMDTVWITGPLTLQRADNEMGVSGYRIDGAGVAPYEDKRP
jgi:hypothetical protein